MTNTIGHHAHNRPRVLSRIASTIACLALGVAAARAQEPPRDDPFANGAWHLQLAGHGAIETWNYNISHEELWGVIPGFTYGLRDGLTFTATWPLYAVDQRGADAWVIGATMGLRGRVHKTARLSVFWEFDVGVSRADVYTPPRGTQFNYLALGGGGATWRLRPGMHLVGTLRWIHISNNGLAGRHRNPDIEAVGPQVGVLMRF